MPMCRTLSLPEVLNGHCTVSPSIFSLLHKGYYFHYVISRRRDALFILILLMNMSVFSYKEIRLKIFSKYFLNHCAAVVPFYLATVVYSKCQSALDCTTQYVSIVQQLNDRYILDAQQRKRDATLLGILPDFQSNTWSAMPNTNCISFKNAAR